MTGPRVTRRILLRTGLGIGAAAILGPACSGRSDQEIAEPDTGDEPDVAGGSDTPVPRPLAMVRTSWSEDPWALGAYAYLPVGATPEARAALAEPVDDRLFFAGEAIDGANPATVHGARASGLATAAMIEQTAEETERIVVVGAGVAGAAAAAPPAGRRAEVGGGVGGAGGAGAAAAARLAAAGHDVVVVEARDRTGGRLHTARPEGWPIPVELGASWIHDAEGDASALAAALDALGVDSVAFDYDDETVGDDGQRAPDGVLVEAEAAVERAVEWAEEDPGDDRSLAAALDASGAADDTDPRLLAHFLRTVVAAEYGADADGMSARWGMAEGAWGDDRLVIGGYGTLVDDLLDGIEVRLRWPVTAITGDDGGLTVTGAGGETITADRVIVTVPLGVLQAGTISFEPALPDGHRRAIDSLGMGLLDKVWLRWAEPWWTEPARYWTRVGGPDDAFVQWFNVAAVTGEPVLLSLVGGRDARRWVGASDDAVLEAALASLRKFRDAGW